MEIMDFCKELIIDGKSPFEECHAASLLQTSDNGFMVMWFGGSREGNNDVAIWMAKRDQTENWSAPVVVSKIAYEPHWNPVLFRKVDGEINLYFKLGIKISDWTTWVMRSKDEGQTWSKPQELVPGDCSGGRGPVKNKPITLSNGIVAAPASIERERWKAFVDLSRDGGNSWNSSQPIAMDNIEIDDKISNNKFGLIQPALWESSPGKVHMLMRSNNGYIYRSDSDNYGQTWCHAYQTELPNNNSGIDLIKLKDNILVLAYNPSDKNWGNRKKLALALSYDNGQKWLNKRIIDCIPDNDDTHGLKELSYPAIIPTGDNTLAMVYTYKRKNIAFLAGSLENIMENSKPL